MVKRNLAHLKRKGVFIMLTLFVRAIFLYALVFLVLRLTGKRQVADLQPFDLLITLLIADLAGCALSEPGVPLVYSIVPILALFLTQRFVTWLCLKSARARRVVCGSPVVLVAEGRMLEENMRRTNYTVIDIMDQLRAKDVFDIRDVAYAILETNGSMSLLLKSGAQTPTRSDLCLPETEAAPSHMLVLDGQACKNELAMLGRDEGWLEARVRELGCRGIRELLYLQQGADGGFCVQKKEGRRHV
ncbi:MAG: DUF421 domain-containing protein [Clostridia bacterium]|nr:DUF421 domain-containing protein [Clostridia bacterium]